MKFSKGDVAHVVDKGRNEMKFGKGDVVHVVDTNEDGSNKIGIVVDVDYKKRLYAVQVNNSPDGTFWCDEKEVW